MGKGVLDYEDLRSLCTHAQPVDRAVSRFGIFNKLMLMFYLGELRRPGEAVRVHMLSWASTLRLSTKYPSHMGQLI